LNSDVVAGEELKEISLLWAPIVSLANRKWLARNLGGAKRNTEEEQESQALWETSIYHLCE